MKDEREESKSSLLRGAGGAISDIKEWNTYQRNVYGILGVGTDGTSCVWCSDRQDHNGHNLPPPTKNVNNIFITSVPYTKSTVYQNLEFNENNDRMGHHHLT